MKRIATRNDPRKVVVIAPIFEYFPILAPALIAQTHKNWELIIIHDGPNKQVEEWIEMMGDERIKYHETEKRYNDYGHTLRAIGLGYVTDGDFILHTNADNYYVPVFLEDMIAHIGDEDVAIYCNMIHSHKDYTVFNSYLTRAAIDCGAILWDARKALELGWKSTEFHADWLLVEDAIKAYGKERIKKVSFPYFVHN